ncbi:MAG: tetratricopeptide repeat protein, partial [Acidobacteria bacterium]|nr:tetratricopeptide repeat protein [Acidobacteriota bacterium]
ENVMVRSRDRIAKVLDFGLAKLTDQPSTKLLNDSDATTVIETSAGMIMGTISYMSPEQARALPVDARTDIFSLGVVLYEMMAGRRPFDGATTSDTLVAILNDDPPPLSTHWPDVPPELERVVAKALEKDVDDRYQTIDDMAVELRRLKQQLEAQASPELSVQLDWKGEGLIEEGSNSVTSKASRRRRTQGGKTRTLKTFSVQYLVSEIKEHKTGVMMAVGPLFLIIIASAYFLRSPAHQSINSLAIMPFSFSSSDPNILADPDREYLSDGITESLINNLSQLPEMKVIASSSMFRYKGQQTDPQKVGQELQVQAMLTGRIVQRGETLTISVELVDTKDNRHIWGQQYDRKMSDLLVVQRDISKQITEQLRLRLTGEEQQQLAKNPTENAEAYQLYLKGRYFWNKRSGYYKTAIDYFNRAIEKDPNYAQAYAGLADCYNVMGDFQVLPANEAYSKARDATNKALAIDDTLAEAHTSRAWIKFAYDWDWPGAEQEFKRAIELNSNYATAHQWYAEYLSTMGRHEEAITEIKRAQELDPLSLIISSTAGWVFYNARQYDQAIVQLRQSIEMDPNFLWSHRNLGWVYEQKGMYEEAIAEFQKVLDLSKGNAGEMALGHTYAVAGKRDEALKMIEQLKEKSQRQYIAAYKFVMIYTGLGEKDLAFEWLEKAYKEHSPDLKNLKVDPRFD